MGVGTQVASLFGVLSLDDSDFQRGAKNAAGTMQDLGSGMQKLGTNLTAIGAPFAGVAFVAAKAWDEFDDVIDQTNAVLTSTGGAAGVTKNQVLALADEIQKQTGVLKTNVIAGEDMLLTFTNIGKTVFPRATKAAVDLSVAMKQDMKSSAIQLGKALNNPIEGISSLTRVGVTFTDQQKDMIAQMVKVGDVAGAQGVILKEIEKEFGGSAAALADPIDHLKASINDLSIDVGGALTDSLNKVIEVAMPFIDSLIEWVDNNQQLVGTVLLVGSALAVIGPIIALIGTGLTAIGGLLAVVFSPIGLIIGAVVLLYKAFQDNFLGIRDFLQPVIDSIVDFFNHFQDRVKLYLSLFELYFAYYITNPISDLWNQIQPALQKVMNWFVADGLPAIQRFLLDVYNNVLTPVFTFISNVWEFVKDGLSKLWEWFTTPGGGLTTIGLALKDVKEKYFDPLINALKKIWTDIQPALNDLKTNLTNIFNWINDHVIQPVVNTVKDLIEKIQQLAGVGAPGSGNGGYNTAGQTPSQISSGISGLFSGPSQADMQAVYQAYLQQHSASGPVPIPPVGGGSSLPLSQQGRFGAGFSANSSTVNTGDIHIYANDKAGGYAAMDGALARARAQGATG